MKKLIVEVWKNTDIKQVESIDVPAGMMMVEGVVGRVNSVNRNKRFYPEGEYRKHVESMTKRIAESGGILGEMEHPKSMSINLNNVSHKIVEVRIDEDGFVRGKILLLDTPKGMIAQSIVRSGSPLPISSRGIGKTSPEGAVTLEYMATFDLVGTAGFQETGLYAVSESLDEQGNIISETFEYVLDDKGNAIEESAFKGIVESVEQRLAAKYDAMFESFLTADKAKVLFAEQFTENVDQLQSFVTEGTETKPVSETTSDSETAMTKSEVLEMLNSHFLDVQIPIIENWSINHLLTKNAEIQEKWLKETFTAQLCEGFEKWMFESVLPKNAQIQEKWLKEVFAKELCEGIQTWATGDFAEKLAVTVEAWVKEDYTNNLCEGIQSFMDNRINESVEEIKDEIYTKQVVPATTVPSTVDDFKPVQEADKAEEKIEESVVVDKPVTILEKFDAMILNAKTAAPIIENVIAEENTTRVDEAAFATGPAWITKMPNRFKHIWECLDANQKAMITRRASVRMMQTQEDINAFWNTLSITNETLNLKAGSNAYKREVVQIDENANHRSAFAALAKSMQ